MATPATSATDATDERRVPHAILIGLPGAGKSTVGRRVAKVLGREFLDFNDEIARREGKSIADIFAEHGEDYFRGLEADLTRTLARRSGIVAAPGGGWICQPGNRELLGGTGRTIYLRVTPEAVFQRLRRISERPLLAAGDPLEKLRDLYAARRGAYESADYVVDAENLTKEQLITEVARIAAAF